LFGVVEEQARANQRETDDAGAAQRKQELASLAVDQCDGDHGHHKVHDGEEDIAPVGLLVVQTRLDEDRGVVADDRVDTRRLGAGQDDASQE